MIAVYGKYAQSYALSTTNTGFAALTPFTPLTDGRTGGGTSFQWCSGAQTTSTTCTITITLTSDLDATAVIGGVGICNVVGLPAGTLITVNGVAQRLVAGIRGELNAFYLPQLSNNTLTIVITNNVNGSASIAASTVFSIGEIVVGRAVQLPTINDSPYLTEDLSDPTAYQRSDGQQLYSAMRKPFRGPYTFGVGPFNATQIWGDVASNIYNGNLASGVMDIKSFRNYLVTTPIFLLCDTPYPGQSSVAAVGAGNLRYDVNFMQTNFMPAKLSVPGILTLDKFPFGSWYPTAVEAC